MTRTGLINELLSLLPRKKIVYLQAHTGWGKTTLVVSGLQAVDVSFDYVNGDDDDFLIRMENLHEDLCVIDDIHMLDSAPYQDQLVQTLANAPSQRKFILLSRTPLPSYLKAFDITGQLALRDIGFLRFQVSDIAELLDLMEAPFTTEMTEQIYAASLGYPVAVKFCCLRIKRGEPFGDTLVSDARQDVYEWYDSSLLGAWDIHMKNILLYLAPFPSFTIELAQMLTGNVDVDKDLLECMKIGSFLNHNASDGSYELHPFFQEYLLWRQHRQWSKEKRSRNMENAGLYYELHKNLPAAMKCYYDSGNMDKLAELLLRNAKGSPGQACFDQTELYYRALPEPMIMASPDLMGAMCMICSLRCQCEESDQWFARLEQYAQSATNAKGDRLCAEERLWHLRVSLPHRKDTDYIGTLLQATDCTQHRSFHMPPVDLTGNQPSVVNGGKDLTFLIHDPQTMYEKMKPIYAGILGKSYAGTDEIALAEALHELGQDTTDVEAMMLVTSGLRKAEVQKNLPLQFAAIGVMSSIYLTQGNAAAAMEYLRGFEQRLPEAEMWLHKNLRAVIARLQMQQGNRDACEAWMRMDAPDEHQPLFITERYRYMTKARMYLWQEDWSDALSLLTTMLEYFENYHRPHGVIEANLLLALALWRMGNEAWRKRLALAVDEARRYDCIRVIADEGIAVKSMLEEMKERDVFAVRLCEAVNCQAVLYPRYLRANTGTGEQLKGIEMKILHLVGQGLSNKEIAELLHLSPNTIKTYLKTLYAKLGVKSRVECSKAAAHMQHT